MPATVGPRGRSTSRESVTTERTMKLRPPKPGPMAKDAMTVQIERGVMGGASVGFAPGCGPAPVSAMNISGRGARRLEQAGGDGGAIERAFANDDERRLARFAGQPGTVEVGIDPRADR